MDQTDPLVVLQFVQGKPLFAEMKYGEKKKTVKMAFEFTQSKLSFYRDVKVGWARVYVKVGCARMYVKVSWKESMSRSAGVHQGRLG